jgi:hypothetical protein
MSKDFLTCRTDVSVTHARIDILTVTFLEIHLKLHIRCSVSITKIIVSLFYLHSIKLRLDYKN